MSDNAVYWVYVLGLAVLCALALPLALAVALGVFVYTALNKRGS